MVNTRAIGKNAEDLAAEYVKKKGYRIIQRNFSTKIGEIDLVGSENGQLVFIEVKARASSKYGLPQESVNKRKQAKLRLVAESYMQRFGMPSAGCRFDVISILLDAESPTIEIIKNAF